MVDLSEIYRNVHLSARQEPGGWIVDIGATGVRTMHHSTSAGAIEEARRYVDSLKGGRKP
ncbi:MAG: hypothetical protein WDN69_00890 [Aliidongia sp.]